MSNKSTIGLDEAEKVIAILEMGSLHELSQSTRDSAIEFVTRLLESGKDYDLVEVIDLMLLVDNDPLKEFATSCKNKIY